jgi:hypothetical protein
LTRRVSSRRELLCAAVTNWGSLDREKPDVGADREKVTDVDEKAMRLNCSLVERIVANRNLFSHDDQHGQKSIQCAASTREIERMIRLTVAGRGGRKITDGTGDSLPVTLFDENII